MVRAGWMIVVLIGAVASATAQEPAVPELPAAVREAQAVLLAAYPELRSTAIAWRATDTEDGFVLAAHAARAPFEDPTEQPALVATRATRDLDGGLASLDLDGELTGRARLSTLQTRAATEPAATVVRDAGGRFVPGDVVTASALVPEALARATGSGSATDVQFGVLAEPGADAFTWRVTLAPDATTDRRTSTVLVFEPVEGRLIALVRR